MEQLDFNVKIPLRTSKIWDSVEDRVNEVSEIREWILELVRWDENLFSIKYLATRDSLTVWFKHEEHANWCAMRWL